MPRVGEAYYELTARDQKLLGALSNAERRMVGAGGTAQRSFGSATQGAFDNSTAAATRFGGAMATAEAKTGRFGGAFKNVTAGLMQGVGIAAFTGVAGAVVGMVGAFGRGITAASDLNETTSKVGVVFGKSAQDILKWGSASATAFGMSQNQALAAAGTFGNLFVALKLPTDQIPVMSKGLVQLAADLASFNNVDPAEALDALRSGLVGETEPLRRFGVNVNEATIAQKALELGLISSVKAGVTPAIKAQATYALILDQTKTAQGDFARTADGLANQQRIAAAKVEDAFAKLGQKLLPIAAKIVPMLTEAMTALLGGLGGVIDGVGNFLDAVKPVTDVIGTAVKAIIAILEVLNDAGALMPIVGSAIAFFLIPSVIALTGAIVGFTVAAAPVILTVGAIVAAVGLLYTAVTAVINVFRSMTGEPPLKSFVELVGEGVDAVKAKMAEMPDAVDEARVGFDAKAALLTDDVSKLPPKIAAVLDDGRGAVAVGAGEMSKPVFEKLQIAQTKAVAVARATPHEIAKALSDATFSVEDAMDAIGEVVESSMSKTAEIASIKAFLTGDKMKEGLNSKRPEVRAIWEAYKLDAEDRLFALQHNVPNIAENTGVLYGDALAKEKARVSSQAALMVGGARSRMTDLRDQAGGYGTATGTAYATSLARGIATNTWLISAKVATISRILAAGSPPKFRENPLYGIDKWGYATGEAYVMPFVAALGRAPSAVRAAMNATRDALTFSGGGLGLGLSIAPGINPGLTRTNVDPARLPAPAQVIVRGGGPTIGAVHVAVDVDKLVAADAAQVRELGRQLGEEIRLTLTRSPTSFSTVG